VAATVNESWNSLKRNFTSLPWPATLPLPAAWCLGIPGTLLHNISLYWFLNSSLNGVVLIASTTLKVQNLYHNRITECHWTRRLLQPFTYPLDSFKNAELTINPCSWWLYISRYNPKKYLTNFVIGWRIQRRDLLSGRTTPLPPTHNFSHVLDYSLSVLQQSGSVTNNPFYGLLCTLLENSQGL
jgi:hypothetical protein